MEAMTFWSPYWSNFPQGRINLWMQKFSHLVSPSKNEMPFGPNLLKMKEKVNNIHWKGKMNEKKWYLIFLNSSTIYWYDLQNLNLFKDKHMKWWGIEWKMEKKYKASKFLQI